MANQGFIKVCPHPVHKIKKKQILDMEYLKFPALFTWRNKSEKTRKIKNHVKIAHKAVVLIFLSF